MIDAHVSVYHRASRQDNNRLLKDSVEQWDCFVAGDNARVTLHTMERAALSISVDEACVALLWDYKSAAKDAVDDLERRFSHPG